VGVERRAGRSCSARSAVRARVGPARRRWDDAVGSIRAVEQSSSRAVEHDLAIIRLDRGSGCPPADPVWTRADGTGWLAGELGNAAERLPLRATRCHPGRQTQILTLDCQRVGTGDRPNWDVAHWSTWRPRSVTYPGRSHRDDSWCPNGPRPFGIPVNVRRKQTQTRLGDIQRGTKMRSETSRFSRARISGRRRRRRGSAAHFERSRRQCI
jgi:hypothetical protein